MTLLALALRIRGMREGLYQDELFTFHEVHGHSLGATLDLVANGLGGGAPLENTPPLFFVLAWLSAKLGNDTVWIRLPSVLASTATVPLVYELGRRTIGPRAGAAAAFFMALTPFAIFYGTEARAYALLTALGVLTAILLLRAVGSTGRGPWVAYGASVAALIYTQYTGIVVLAAEAVWVLWLHRERWRALALAVAGALLAFVPWLPFVRNNPADFGSLAALSGFNHLDALRQWLLGFPDSAPKAVPGHAAWWLISLAVLLMAATRARTLACRRPANARSALPSAPQVLVILLALVAPGAALLYTVLGQDLIAFPRNLIGSLPFVALLLGWLLAAPAGRSRFLAAGLAGAALILGSARTLQAANQRPDFRDLAQALEERSQGRGVLVYYGGGFDPFILRNHLAPYLHDAFPTRGATPVVRGSLARAISRRSRYERVYVAGLRGRNVSLPFPGLARGWRLVRRQDFAGTFELTLASYRRR